MNWLFFNWSSMHLLQQLGPSHVPLSRTFFNWYYWCVNVGSFIGIGVLAFVEQDSPGACTNGYW